MVSLFICEATNAQKMEIFEKKSKFGLTSNGKVVVKNTYDEIKQLPDNYFLVKKDGKLGVINSRSRLVIPEMYEDLIYFNEDLFLVKQDRKWGLVSNTNGTVLSISYVGFSQIDDYLFEIKKDGLIGIINKYGGIVIPAIYDKIEKFGGTLYSVEIDRKKGIVNDIGIEVMPVIYDDIRIMPGTQHFEVRVNGKCGIIDIKGNYIINAEFDEIDNSSYSFMVLKKGEKMGFYINNIYIPADYDKIMYTQPSMGIIAVKKGKKFGIITTEGKVIDAVYDNISRFNGGVAFVEKNGRLMNINKDGKEISL